MIISPDIFSKVKGKTFFPNSSFGSKSPFQISPKAFQTIYVISLAISIFTFTMFYHPVNISFCSNPGVALPGIRAYGGPSPNPLFYKGDKSFSLYVLNNLGPDLSTSTQDPKDRGFLCSSPSFRFSFFLCSLFVLPLPSQIGLIHFYRTTEYVRNIFYHHPSYQKQSPQNPFPFQTNFCGNIVTGQPLEKGHQKRSPFRCLESEGKMVQFPFVLTSYTTAFLTPNYIAFAVQTTRTFMSFCHATTLS